LEGEGTAGPARTVAERAAALFGHPLFAGAPATVLGDAVGLAEKLAAKGLREVDAALAAAAVANASRPASGTAGYLADCPVEPLSPPGSAAAKEDEAFEGYALPVQDPFPARALGLADVPNPGAPSASQGAVGEGDTAGAAATGTVVFTGLYHISGGDLTWCSRTDRRVLPSGYNA